MMMRLRMRMRMRIRRTRIMMKARGDNDNNEDVVSIAMLSSLRASQCCLCRERRDLVLVADFVVLSL